MSEVAWGLAALLVGACWLAARSAVELRRLVRRMPHPPAPSDGLERTLERS